MSGCVNFGQAVGQVSQRHIHGTAHVWLWASMVIIHALHKFQQHSERTFNSWHMCGCGLVCVTCHITDTQFLSTVNARTHLSVVISSSVSCKVQPTRDGRPLEPIDVHSRNRLHRHKQLKLPGGPGSTRNFCPLVLVSAMVQLKTNCWAKVRVFVCVFYC